MSLSNDLFKKAFSTGLSLAVFAGEKLQTALVTVLEKSKTMQERYAPEVEEKQEEEKVETTGEASKDEADTSTEAPKASRWEEYEHKLRRLVEAAISKFNFIRGDDHQRMEERISLLEEKLSYIAKLVSEQAEERV